MQKEVEIALLTKLVPPCPPGIIFTIGLGFHFTIFFFVVVHAKTKKFQRHSERNSCKRLYWGRDYKLGVLAASRTEGTEKKETVFSALEIKY